jgi:hypothetical protein
MKVKNTMLQSAAYRDGVAQRLPMGRLKRLGNGHGGYSRSAMQRFSVNCKGNERDNSTGSLG